jgi:hypothetical protein
MLLDIQIDLMQHGQARVWWRHSTQPGTVRADIQIDCWTYSLMRRQLWSVVLDARPLASGRGEQDGEAITNAWTALRNQLQQHDKGGPVEWVVGQGGTSREQGQAPTLDMALDAALDAACGLLRPAPLGSSCQPALRSAHRPV